MDVLLEGDYVKVKGIGILAVKGVIHPPHSVVAIPKYDEALRNVRRLIDGYLLIKDSSPDVLRFDDYSGQVLPIFELSSVDEMIRARDWGTRLRSGQGDELVERALRLMGLLTKGSGLSPDLLGISGSILLGMHGGHSDVDLIIYSRTGAKKSLEALASLREEKVLRPVSAREPGDLLVKRSGCPITPEVWIRHESRKLFYGIFERTTYSAKAVLLPEEFWERYEDRRWRELGRVTIEALVTDDEYSVFTPNRYDIDLIKVVAGELKSSMLTHVVSYRSRFAEQARAGEKIIVSGRLEKDLNTSELRIFLRNEEEDFIAVKNLLGSS